MSTGKNDPEPSNQQTSLIPLEQIAKLPTLAIVALACRNARRWQPWLRTRDSGLTEHSQSICETAILQSETLASGRAPAGRHVGFYSSLRDEVFRLEVEFGVANNPLTIQRHFALQAIKWCAVAISVAAVAARSEIEKAYWVVEVMSLENQAFESFAYTRVDPRQPRTALRTDCNWLLFLSKRYNWTDETPIDFDLLGPLWPNGAPEWWPEEDLALSDKPPCLLLEFTVPAGVDKVEADRLIGEIALRANEMHHAFGGNGLTFADVNVHECEPALVPVGGGDDEGEGGAA